MDGKIAGSGEIKCVILYESQADHDLEIGLTGGANGGYRLPEGKLRSGETGVDAALRIFKSLAGSDSKNSVIKDLGPVSGSASEHYLIVTERKINGLEWMSFERTKEKVPDTKEALVTARQVFYYTKLVPDPEKARSLAVLLPTYNGEATVGETIDSVTRALQALPAWMGKEIIVCADHCSDGTISVVEESFGRIGPGVKKQLIENCGRKGKSDALNQSFASTDADLLWLVDDDVSLDRKCGLELVEALGKHPDMKCLFCRWIRKPLKAGGWTKRFWHEVLGVKFDVQSYRKPSEYLLGGSVLIRREDYVKFPWYVSNEDQFLQYVYWPKTLKVDEAFLHFNSVSSLADYYRRFVRIVGSSNEMLGEFSGKRVALCSRALKREIDYKKVFKFPLRILISFIAYHCIRFCVSKVVAIRFAVKKGYAWRRVSQR